MFWCSYSFWSGFFNLLFRSLLINDGTAGKLETWHSQNPTTIYGSGTSNGLCLPIFISFLCFKLLFCPLGHKNINFLPGAAASFLQLAGGGVLSITGTDSDRGFRQSGTFLSMFLEVRCPTDSVKHGTVNPQGGSGFSAATAIKKNKILTSPAILQTLTSFF